MKTAASRILAGYVVLNAAVLLVFLAIWRSPDFAISDLAAAGPGTNAFSLHVSLALTWLLCSLTLAAARFRWISRENVVLTVCGVFVAMLYLAFLREHVYFGDYQAYVVAAGNIVNGEAFHARYVYPPFWASLLADLYRLFGKPGAIYACFVLNHLSLWAFFLLGSRFLTRCGVSLHLAALLMAAATIVNVPLLRNMVYVQINLLLVDSILLGILVLRRSPALSGLSIAIGTHLKLIPIFFVPLFVWARRKTWLNWYVAATLGIVLLTSMTDGFSYYFDSAHNLGSWKLEKLRSSSLSGLISNTNSLFGIELPARTIWTLVSGFLTLWLYFLAYKAVKEKPFARSGDAESDLLINASVPCMFLLPVVSPTVWTHHLVVLIVPSILIFLRLRTGSQTALFVFAYFFSMWFPVFDFYPLSYLRLLGWLALVGLMSHAVLRPGVPAWVSVLDATVVSAVQRLGSSVESEATSAEGLR